MKLTTHFRRFPGACRVGIWILWLIATLVIIPTWQIPGALSDSVHKNLASAAKYGPSYGDHLMFVFCQQAEARVKAASTFTLADYYRELYGEHRYEAELRHQGIQFTNMPVNELVNCMQNRVGLHDGLLFSRITGEDIAKAQEPEEEAYYKWHLKRFHEEPEDVAYLTHHSDQLEINWWQIGFVLGWRYLALCLMAGLLYLLRWGRDASDEPEAAEYLEQLRQDIPFWKACLGWPAVLTKYPFEYLREFRLAVSMQRYRSNVWEPITVADKQRIRRIASNKQAFKAWFKERKQLPAPRWGFALAATACIVMLYAPQRAAAATPRTVTLRCQVEARGRGDPVHLRAVSPPPLVQHVTVVPAPPEPAPPDPLCQQVTTRWATLSARLQAGWRRQVDHVPLSSLRLSV